VFPAEIAIIADFKSVQFEFDKYHENNIKSNWVNILWPELCSGLWDDKAIGNSAL
jgi:hypothetical protein